MENIKQQLLEDVKRIYLGNLSTVETDIQLPKQGKNGTEFAWQSSADYLISPEGKVTRPAFGAGNRQVTLSLTATLEQEMIKKEFSANVLEKEYPFKILSAYPINLYCKPQQMPILPSVAVVKNSLGEDCVMPVKWENIASCDMLENTQIAVKGEVKDGVDIYANIIVTQDPQLLTPYQKIDKTSATFKQGCVTLLPEGDFYNQQQRFFKFLLTVNDDSMLYNFRKVAGLDTKNAEPMTGWDAPECKLKGHTTGHYLSGLALCYKVTSDEKIFSKIEYMITELDKCQKAMTAQKDEFKEGFLSAYDETQFDLLEEYTTYPSIWAPYYTLHKIMAGLRDCYLYAQNNTSLEILKGIGVWIYNRLTKLDKSQRDRMWAMYIAGEYGGINETLADLYLITKDERFLQASKYFDNDKLYLPMKMGIDALGNLHANQHIPQIVGVLKQYEASGEINRFELAKQFWQFVVNDHTYSIGGTGETEMFKPKRQIAKFISPKTAESCASYNMLKITGTLFEYSSDALYMDYYENTVTNHILSCGDISNQSGASTYFMPTSPGATKSFDATENSCCHGTGLENHFKYNEYIYTQHNDEVWINLFISSKLSTQECELSMQCTTKDTGIEAKINISKYLGKALKIREPKWAKSIKVKLDGAEIKTTINQGYISLQPQNKVCEITIEFECFGYLKHTLDDNKIASVCWGPYVLAFISEKTEYLTFKLSNKNLQEKLQHTGGLNFTLEGYSLLPLNKISDQQYHLYVKTE